MYLNDAPSLLFNWTAARRGTRVKSAFRAASFAAPLCREIELFALLCSARFYTAVLGQGGNAYVYIFVMYTDRKVGVDEACEC